MNRPPAVPPLTRRRSSSPREHVLWYWRNEVLCVGQGSRTICTIGCKGCVCVLGGEPGGQVPERSHSDGWIGGVKGPEGYVSGGELWKKIRLDGTTPKVLLCLSQDVDIYISALYLELGRFYFTSNPPPLLLSGGWVMIYRGTAHHYLPCPIDDKWLGSTGNYHRCQPAKRGSSSSRRPSHPIPAQDLASAGHSQQQILNY